VAGAWSSRRGLEKFERNLRDPDGVHAKMFHKIIQKKTCLDLFWANIKYPIFLGVIWVTLTIIGDRIGGVILASFFLLLLVKIGRLLPINRGRDVKSLAIYLVFGILFCLQGAFPPEGKLGFSEYHLWEVWLVWMIWKRVVDMSDMDVNLFVFEVAGFLPGGGEGAVVGELEERLSSAELLEFARFLAEGGMVNDYRWVRPGEELMLRAGALPSSFLFAPVNFLLQGFRWRQWTWISLKADGTVSAHCMEAVARHASKETENEIKDLGALEQRVASAVAAAWRIFCVGYFNQAGRILGNFPLAEVLLKPPAPSWTWPGLLKTFSLAFAIWVVGVWGVLLFSHNDEQGMALFYFMVSGVGMVISAILWALAESFRRR
jgi:hypothetical protein